MDADGACWTAPNPEVRMSFSWTIGRRKAEDQLQTDEQAAVDVQTPQRFGHPWRTSRIDSNGYNRKGPAE